MQKLKDFTDAVSGKPIANVNVVINRKMYQWFPWRSISRVDKSMLCMIQSRATKSTKACYAWSGPGLQSPQKHAMHDLVQAYKVHKSMLCMIWSRSTKSTKACYAWSGPGLQSRQEHAMHDPVQAYKVHKSMLCMIRSRPTKSDLLHIEQTKDTTFNWCCLDPEMWSKSLTVAEMAKA